MTGYQHQIDRAEATLARIAATVERTEGLLAAVLDTLVTRTPAPRPAQRAPELPPVYTQGAHYAAAFPPPLTESAPPLQTDPDYGFDLNALSKLAAARWVTPRKSAPGSRVVEFGPFDGPTMGALPLPPKRGDSIYRVAGPNGELPDSAGTPGAINPDVTDDPAVIAKTLGTPGWTARVRPPVAYTNALKVQVMAEYGLVGNPSDFELDHLVPLCCGGNPVSQQNLWAQRRTGINGASTKDLTEVAAQHAILNGHMSLEEVRRGFMTDWTALHAALFSNPAVVRGLMAMQPPPEDEP